MNEVSDGINLDNGEILYVCPVCKANHPNEIYTKRKLYFNPKKQVGHCFVCDSILIGDGYDLSNFKNNSFDTFISNRLDSLRESKEKYNNQLFDINSLLDAKNDKECLSYLLSRKMDLDILNKYIFKVFYLQSNKKSILLGSSLKNNKFTDFFQVRQLDKNAVPKYISSPNSIKPLGLIDYIKGYNIIICEGFFSAYSASIYSGYEPLVLFGKSLTKFQEFQLNDKLKDHNVDEIVCCLDGGYDNDNRRLFRTLYSNEYVDKVSIVTLPNDKDPNDLTQDEFLYYFNNRKFIIF